MWAFTAAGFVAGQVTRVYTGSPQLVIRAALEVYGGYYAVAVDKRLSLITITLPFKTPILSEQRIWTLFRNIHSKKPDAALQETARSVNETTLTHHKLYTSSTT